MKQLRAALIFAAEYRSRRSRISRINGFKRVRVHNGSRTRQDFVDHRRAGPVVFERDP